MTNQFNPAFPVAKQRLSQDSTTFTERSKTLALALCLSLVPALGIGVTSYHFASEAVTQQITQTQLNKSVISPTLQKQLLVNLLLASGVTALSVSAIAFLAYRLRAPKLPSAKELLFGEIAVQNQPVDFDALYRKAVEGARAILNTDRVIIYSFDDNWNGTIVAESIAPEWVPSLDNQIVDTCIKNSKGGLYKNGRIYVVNDIYQANLSDCHLKLLETYEVKANIVVPLIKDDQLTGLMIAHQCDKPRNWQPDEVDFFVQLASLISLRLSRMNFLQQREKAEQERAFSSIALRIRQSLDPEQAFNIAVHEIRPVLNVDRVLICRLNPSQKDGIVVAESAVADVPPMLGLRLQDIPAAGTDYMMEYKNGYVHAISNVSKGAHKTISEVHRIKASLVAPIRAENQLIGLIIAHQCSELRNWEKPTINLLRDLSAQIGLAFEQATLLKSVAIGCQQTQLLADFTSRIRQSLNLEDILSTSVEDIRETLETDRVLIYCFNADGTGGKITTQSVAPDYSIVQDSLIHQLFKEENFQGYKTGSLCVAHDIYEGDLNPSHERLLKRLRIRAYMVAPILSGNQLVGFLCAHQCSGARDWQQSEFYLLKQLAAQVGFALDQAKLMEQVQVFSQHQQQQAELLRHQLISLVNNVEEATQGNLTVRAEVTEGEIGTVADFFNAVIESLGEIVTQVKRTTTQVNAALGENEGAIRQLSFVSNQQAEEATRTLDSIEQMSHSIQQVADSACQAAAVTRIASVTAQESGEVMDRTVETILNLQETVAETAKKLERLGSSSQQIFQVVSLIKEIALQTNLLAINAGLEATRAGEEGKGFAIVAKEIGDLAAHSANATKDIEEIVAVIQAETKQVFEAMQQSVIQVVEGTHMVEVTKQSLGRILEVSHQIDQLVESISIAAGTQAKTSQVVTNLMKQMAKVSAETSQASHEISNSLQQTVVIAHQLQASVEVFKVEDLG